MTIGLSRFDRAKGRTMSRISRSMTMLLLLSCLALSSIAAEKRISHAQLPEAVRKTADEQSKGATVRNYTTEVENDQREYEVEMISNGHSKDISIAPNGRLLEIEEQVDINSLPGSVVSALRSKAGQGLIRKVESITKNGALVAYEAQVQAGKKHSEIQVGPKGEALKREE